MEGVLVCSLNFIFCHCTVNHPTTDIVYYFLMCMALDNNIISIIFGSAEVSFFFFLLITEKLR